MSAHFCLPLCSQIKLFDSTNYLKAFNVGDVWVTVGWSSDVIPVAKRMSSVTVIVPKSGATLWADLWVSTFVSSLLLPLRFQMPITYLDANP